MCVTYFLLIFISMDTLLIRGTNGKLQLVTLLKTWNDAKEYCLSKNGTLAVLSNEAKADAFRLLNENNVTTAWTGRISVLSPWIENYGCYMFTQDLQNYKQRSFQTQILSNCLKFCNNDTFFGVKDSSCYCLGSNYTNLQPALPSFCSKTCHGSMGIACGGVTVISIYMYIRGIERNIDDDRKSLCMAVECRTSPSINLRYFAEGCDQYLNVLCNDTNNPQASDQWAVNMAYCKGKGESPLQFNPNYQWFCGRIQLSQVWTGVFRQSIKTNLKSNFDDNPLMCTSFDKKANDNGVFKDNETCNDAKYFFCEIGDEQISTTVTTLKPPIIVISTSNVKRGPNTSKRKINSTIEGTSVFTTKSLFTTDKMNRTRGSLYYVSGGYSESRNNHIGYIIGSVIAAVIVVVIIVVIVIRKRRNTATKQDKNSKTNQQLVATKDFKTTEEENKSENKGQDYSKTQILSQSQEVEYATAGDNHSNLNNDVYVSTNEGEYDHLNETDRRKIKGEGRDNLYAHTFETDNDNVYDSASQIQNMPSDNTADTYYDHSQVPMSVSASYNPNSYDKVQLNTSREERKT